MVRETLWNVRVKPWAKRYSQLQPSFRLGPSWASFGHLLGSSWTEFKQFQIFAQLEPGFSHLANPAKCDWKVGQCSGKSLQIVVDVCSPKVLCVQEWKHQPPVLDQDAERGAVSSVCAPAGLRWRVQSALFIRWQPWQVCAQDAAGWLLVAPGTSSSTREYVLVFRTQSDCGPCSVASHVPTLPWLRSRVWVRVGLGSGLATGKGCVGTWPVTRLGLLPITCTIATRSVSNCCSFCKARQNLSVSRHVHSWIGRCEWLVNGAFDASCLLAPSAFYVNRLDIQPFTLLLRAWSSQQLSRPSMEQLLLKCRYLIRKQKWVNFWLTVLL